MRMRKKILSIALTAILAVTSIPWMRVSAETVVTGETVEIPAQTEQAGSTEEAPQVVEVPDVTVSYHTHIQTYGDTQGMKKDGEMAGTSGEAKRLENIQITVAGNENLGVRYTTHCQSYGWMPWSRDGQVNGTSGQAKRLEAIKIELTGEAKEDYDVYYRVHAQSYGWLGWAKNGEPSGTAGYAKRLEGIQIIVLKKDSPAPGMDYAGVNASYEKHDGRTYIAAPGSETISIPGDSEDQPLIYTTHVQTYGWQPWKKSGEVAGTSGEGKRLEGIRIQLGNVPYSGSIKYRTHVQGYGWQDWVKDGEVSGTVGEGKRLEAIQIQLEGEIAEHYDVYYRVHVQKFGWMRWTSNGSKAGTEELAKRMEAIEIRLLEKGSKDPDITENSGWAFTDAMIYPEYLHYIYFPERAKNEPKSGIGVDVVNYAKQFLGTKYVYGGSDLKNGVDCSGFTMKVYEHFGYSLPHGATLQSKMGRPVSTEDLMPGDLVFYSDDDGKTMYHVAMYAGNGEIIHSDGSVHISDAAFSYGGPYKAVRLLPWY